LKGLITAVMSFIATHLSGTLSCADLPPAAFRPLSRSVSGP
jgi:hypothetical protein